MTRSPSDIMTLALALRRNGFASQDVMLRVTPAELNELRHQLRSFDRFQIGGDKPAEVGDQGMLMGYYFQCV